MQYVKVPIPAQEFPNSDWSILEVLIIHLIDVLKFASKMYIVESKSEAKFGEWATGKISF